MADDHRALAQRGGQCCALMRRMTREDEVRGGRRQYIEAKPDQSAVEPLPAFDHTVSALLKIGFVLQRGNGAGTGGTPKRVGS